MLVGLELDILRYMLSHPDAEDSIEGVAQWWLMEQRIVDTVRETRAALGELTARGWVVESGTGRPVRYRLNPARREEAERYVARAQELSRTGEPSGRGSSCGND